MIVGTAWCLLATAMACAAEKWRFPDELGPETLHIGSQVRFIESDNSRIERNPRLQSDGVPFKQPTETDGFYNRPPGAGRYPVKIKDHLNQSLQARRKPHIIVESGSLESDGTLDSLQFCKCLSTPECGLRSDSEKACGSGKFLCCYKRGTSGKQHNSEVFNEVEDERPVLLPGQQNPARPFPAPIGSELHTGFGPGDPNEIGIVASVDRPDALIGQKGQISNNGQRRVLIGPNGPTGAIGPKQPIRGVLVGPGGPTGIIGPTTTRRDVGPQVPNFIFPDHSAQQAILVGPGGPTGIIGPGYGGRPVLVGPGGPTGIIGPNGPGNRGVLVGPGGPTGIIGPANNRQQRPGYLGQPVGVNRPTLVGPGGPTGLIGPYYG